MSAEPRILGRIHDGFLGGIHTDPGVNRVTLSIRRTDGSHCAVVFKGVVRFRCDSFLEGNIVLSLVEEVPNDLAGWLQSRFGEYAPGLEEVRDAIMTRRLHCYSLTSSYGADASCIASQIEFRDEQA
jgi:hypothetical protein